MYLTLNLGKRLMLLLCLVLVGFFLTSVISFVLVLKFGESSTPALRIITVLQDILVFIVPALVTAMLVTRQPATLLGIDQRIPLLQMVLWVLVIVSATPLMNVVIWLNTNMPLPDDLYASLMAMEQNAANTVETMMGPHTIGSLVVSLLLVGVFAGFSEELLFRGGLQRLLVTGGVNSHLAIWLTAALFSLMHMQFFGFVPRMLLGAAFGYALLWSRSLWVPIIMHAFNNCVYVIVQWNNYGNPSASDIDSLGISGDIVYDAVAVLLSLALVTTAIYFAQKFARVNMPAVKP